MAQRLFILTLLLWSGFYSAPSLVASPFGPTATGRFLPVDQAFAFDFKQQNDKLSLSWQIGPGYYLYQQKFAFVPTQATIGTPVFPAGQPHRDEFFGDVSIYRQQVVVTIPIQQADNNGSLSVTYQGCAESGFCYPPETRVIPLNAVAATPSVSNAMPANRPTADKPAEAPAVTKLPFSPLWALLIGLGIAFTPCVLPMYPLISAIILGREKPPSSRRIFLLSLVYVQGMALTYTLLGVVVAAAGMQFQAAFQHPYILIGLSLLFIALALSMFGFYSLQLPASLQTRLAHWSNQQQGGSLSGVFVMGALAGLICSPCTTAPLSAILLYIAQSGNLLAGGGTLYLYALGMGIPLVAVTVFGHRLLPRNGPWMQYVKEAFGFIILALPIILLERLLGESWGLRLWSLLGIAFFSWGFILSLRSHHKLIRLVQVLLLGATLMAAYPLQQAIFGQPSSQQHLSALPFQRIHNLDELHAALQQARGRPVMLDLYADWCIACKEFEKYTFSNSAVQTTLTSMNMVLLQVDVTANTAEQVKLLKALQVLGLPSILFFDVEGKEITAIRVAGFMDAQQFLTQLRSITP